MLNLLVARGVASVLSRLTNSHASIFMLHRFSVPDLRVSGHEPAALRRTLANLRKERYNLMSLQDLFNRLREGRPVKRAVAFTIDDGYFDHAEIAAPIFSEFDCPLTCFVTTGFLDGKVWFWWDRLMYIFENTKLNEITSRVGAKEIHYRWHSPATRREAWWSLNLQCQDASEADRLACIENLSRDAEVTLPIAAPARFAPMSWDRARQLEKNGVAFGPHTVTHPVLGTTSTSQAEWEITESWNRLSAEVARPLRLFCYPNGRSQDIGDREIATVRRLGLWGGLMAQPGELNPASFRRSETAAYRIPRFGYSDDWSQVVQCISGLENAKARFRSAKHLTAGRQKPFLQRFERKTGCTA
jgi:peptidoglycan/xylan/chitin deacetylase (PgdA/CDA1 family)